MHHFSICPTSVSATGNISAKEIGHDELEILLKFPSLKHIVHIMPFYIMSTNKLHTLGLTPFKRNGCKWAVRAQEEHIQFNSPLNEELKLQIAVTHADFNFVKITVIIIIGYEISLRAVEDTIILETHRTRLMEVTLNYSLISHEWGMCSSFGFDHLLSWSS